jgi:hypothetical protein
MGKCIQRARAAAKATRRKPTLTDGMESVAKNLRQFGYPDVTGPMIREIYDGWLTGKRFPDLPHGIIAGLAESQFDEHKDVLAALGD